MSRSTALPNCCKEVEPSEPKPQHPASCMRIPFALRPSPFTFHLTLMPLPFSLPGLWTLVAGVLTLLLSIITSAHVVLHKRDSRSAVGWVGLIWLAPIVGSVAYILLGVNRIRRRATEQRALQPITSTGEFERIPQLSGEVSLSGRLVHLESLGRLVDRVAGRALCDGNAITPLSNGDEAYPAMLDAINAAEHSIALSTYIFDNDDAGLHFVEALEAAVIRGVQARVLIDAVGARYSRPSIVRELRRRRIRVARFGVAVIPWRMPYMNLRNHRKILVVDGKVGFTGGMNLRQGNMVVRNPKYPVQDLHFRIDGPVVLHLMQTFVEDWAFTTREVLEGDVWFPQLKSAGTVVARGVTDGPDGDFEKARLVFLGALACAQRSVRIVTPYFVPDAGLISAINVAALRGVRVEIVLPQKNNLALVKWASTHQLWQVLQRGARVFLTPPPFDHTKIMVVDGGWSLVGSSNWDARSLRLNWEFVVECYDEPLASELNLLVDAKIAKATRVRKDDVDARPLPVKLRDGIARLAAPYL